MNISITNVFYFPNLVDVRTAAKCGSANFKLLDAAIRTQVFDTTAKMTVRRFKNRAGPINFRDELVWQYADILDMPFRKESTRFAIKRDPVKRFLSAVDFLEKQMAKFNTQEDLGARVKEQQRTPRAYPLKGFASLEEAVSSLENGMIMDPHLNTQTFYYGNINQYDYVYDLVDMRQALEHIVSLIGNDNIPNPNFWIKSHRNKSPKILSLQLTDDLAERIKTLYRVDYDNGWC